jgi:hypothetical protein
MQKPPQKVKGLNPKTSEPKTAEKELAVNQNSGTNEAKTQKVTTPAVSEKKAENNTTSGNKAQANNTASNESQARKNEQAEQLTKQNSPKVKRNPTVTHRPIVRKKEQKLPEPMSPRPRWCRINQKQKLLVLLQCTRRKNTLPIVL